MQEVAFTAARCRFAGGSSRAICIYHRAVRSEKSQLVSIQSIHSPCATLPLASPEQFAYTYGVLDCTAHCVLELDVLGVDLGSQVLRHGFHTRKIALPWAIKKEQPSSPGESEGRSIKNAHSGAV